MQSRTSKNSDIKIFLKNLFNSFSIQNVHYCILNDLNIYTQKIDGDLDVWISLSDHVKFKRIIETLCHKLGWLIIKPDISPRLSSEVERKYYIVKKAQPNVVLHLDIWTYPHWRGLPFLDIEKIHNSIIIDSNGLFRLDRSVEAGFGLIKDLIYKGEISDKKKNKIIKYMNKGNKPFARVFDIPLGPQTVEKIIEKCRTSNWKDLEKNYYKIRWSLLKHALLNNFRSQMYNWYRYLLGIIKIIVFSNYGLFVVFVGPDGCGKTSMIKTLLNSTISKKVFGNRYYFHTNFHFIPSLRKIAHYLRLISKSELDSMSQISRQLRPRSEFRSIINPIYYGLGAYLGKLWLWYRNKRSGSLITFDRYYYEYMIQNEYSSCPRWILTIFMKIIPQPDLTIFLKAQPDVVFNRKPEMPLAEIEKQMKTIEGLNDKLKNFIEIDTQGGFAKTANSIRIAVVEALEGKYTK